MTRQRAPSLARPPRATNLERRLAAATSETEREAILTGPASYDVLLARVLARARREKESTGRPISDRRYRIVPVLPRPEATP